MNSYLCCKKRPYFAHPFKSTEKSNLHVKLSIQDKETREEIRSIRRFRTLEKRLFSIFSAIDSLRTSGSDRSSISLCFIPK
jgi:hypothetical protein